MELYQQAVKGEPSSLERLVRRHYQTVYRLAYKWCGVQQDAEDITQEVFVKMVGKMDRFQRNASVKTWLYRITLNAAKDFNRKNANRRKYESAFALEQSSGNPTSSPPSETDAKSLYAAIDRLPVKQKSAALLVFSEGLSHKEAAGVLQCAESTISWRIFMARKKLQKIWMSIDQP